MEFMLLFLSPAGAPHDPDRFAAMGRFSAELASRGILRRGAPLASESDAATVRVRDGRAFVSDGPFAESKEVIGGFWIIDVAGRDEALEIARRCPHARSAAVEVHAVASRHLYTDSERGTPFVFVFRVEPGLSDPDGAKLREMLAFSEGLERDGQMIETAPLKVDPRPARIEPRGGKVLVTDGPFAESKEGVGGYGLVRVADRPTAIELAKRYPHARWGPIELREILFFDRV